MVLLTLISIGMTGNLMSQVKPLTELIEMASSITERFEMANRAEITAEEGQALDNLKNQMDAVVISLRELKLREHIPEDELCSLERILMKIHKSSIAL